MICFLFTFIYICSRRSCLRNALKYKFPSFGDVFFLDARIGKNLGLSQARVPWERDKCNSSAQCTCLWAFRHRESGGAISVLSTPKGGAVKAYHEIINIFFITGPQGNDNNNDADDDIIIIMYF